MIYYSASQRAFYDSDIHGVRTVIVPDPAFKHPMVTVIHPMWKRPRIKVPDPDWKAPLIEVPDPKFVAPKDQPDAEAPMIKVPDPKKKAPLVDMPDKDAEPPMIETPDPSIEHPLVTMPNPACKIPADAVEIMPAEHKALLMSQTLGKEIVPGPDGRPTVREREIKPENIRAQRNELLRTCDWVKHRADEQGATMPQAWREYRQALRDVTKQPGFPANVQWPTPPS